MLATLEQRLLCVCEEMAGMDSRFVEKERAASLNELAPFGFPVKMVESFAGRKLPYGEVPGGEGCSVYIYIY